MPIHQSEPPANVQADQQRDRLFKERIEHVAEATGLTPVLLLGVIGAWWAACKKFKRSSASSEKAAERRAQEEHRQPVALYLGGHWTPLRPRLPGWYLLADREGTLRRVEYVDPDAPKTFAEPWCAWYWSRPVVMPREVPTWAT